MISDFNIPALIDILLYINYNVEKKNGGKQTVMCSDYMGFFYF